MGLDKKEEQISRLRWEYYTSIYLAVAIVAGLATWIAVSISLEDFVGLTVGALIHAGVLILASREVVDLYVRIKKLENPS